MNLLILHSAYNSASPSGENLVVENEIRLLKSKGHLVHAPELSASRPQISWFRILVKNFVFRKYFPRRIYSYSSKKYLKRNGIQLIHCHNFFPLVDLSLLEAAVELDIPIVFSIHNYRFLCINGLFYRANQICTLCIDSNKFGKLHNCYKNSRLMSLLASKSQTQYLHYLKLASKVLVLNNFTKNILIQKGISVEKIAIKRNSTQDRYISHVEKRKKAKNVLWVGRIDSSKGLAYLIEAWNGSKLPRLGYQLRIVGDGPLRKALEFGELNNPSIAFMGRKSESDLDLIYSDSNFLLVSSRWLEGFPMVIIEASMHNLRVIAPNVGSFIDLAAEKWVSLVRNEIEFWIEALNQIPKHSHSNGSRKWYLENCTEERVISSLMSLYEGLIS